VEVLELGGSENGEGKGKEVVEGETEGGLGFPSAEIMVPFEVVDPTPLSGSNLGCHCPHCR